MANKELCKAMQELADKYAGGNVKGLARLVLAKVEAEEKLLAAIRRGGQC